MTEETSIALRPATGNVPPDRPPPGASAAAGEGSVATRTVRPLVTAGWWLLAIASRGLTVVKQLWRRVPRVVQDGVHAALDSSGVPYVLNYIAEYRATHQRDNFAGNLLALNTAYVAASADQREKLARQFKEILYALVMRNGVRRSTHPMRQNRILTKVLTDPRCRLHTRAIRVLEVGSSTGVAALDNVATLGRYYQIRSYVLGDLFFHLHYDTDRECIFDEEFNLLQVKLKDRFFSIYRPERSGRRYGVGSAILLFPFDLISRYLKRRFVYAERSTNVPLLLLHPDVQAKVNAGELAVRKMDVFRDIGERYDVILCFNLLLQSYFSQDQIATGIHNLGNALAEQGLLIMGDEASFSVTRKVDGQLVLVSQEGRF